jgi:hypothetical protein
MEPGLPDLTLWYRVETVDVASTTEDGADDFMIETNIMDHNGGVITAVLHGQTDAPVPRYFSIVPTSAFFETRSMDNIARHF